MNSFKIKLLAIKRLGMLLVLFLSIITSASAQRVALKTNALYWATLSPNLGVEFKFNRHITLNLEGVINRLKVSDCDTRGTIFSAEGRYWFSGRPQAGHFLGIMVLGSNYNLLLKGHRHDGDAIGGGLTYGYSFVLSRHWSLETSIGGGAIYFREKNYKETLEEAHDGPNFMKCKLFPIKAGVSFVYIIK